MIFIFFGKLNCLQHVGNCQMSWSSLNAGAKFFTEDETKLVYIVNVLTIYFVSALWKKQLLLKLLLSTEQYQNHEIMIVKNELFLIIRLTQTLFILVRSKTSYNNTEIILLKLYLSYKFLLIRFRDFFNL